MRRDVTCLPSVSLCVFDQIGDMRGHITVAEPAPVQHTTSRLRVGIPERVHEGPVAPAISRYDERCVFQFANKGRP